MHLSYWETDERYQCHGYEEDGKRLLAEEIAGSSYKLVVLDDDPTGVQTVHGVSVYTHWDYASILQGFQEENRLFFVLTNSRAMTEEQTTQVHTEIARNVLAAARETGKPFLMISRGDSTLRGHYPLEMEVLKEELERGLGRPVDGEFVIPFFQAGGRYTIDNVHYVKYGDEFIPAAETEFARDRTFGYSHSDLREYIEEKTQGRIKAQDVKTVGLGELRTAQFENVEAILASMEGFDRGIVNALGPKDLETFCVALYRQLKKGKYYLFRTAADFVKVIGGISDKPLLKKADMLTASSLQETDPAQETIPAGGEHGGIVVIGSHTAKTTAQLEELRKLEELVFLEFNSDLVLEDRLEEEVIRVTGLSGSYIREGKTVVIYTRRKLLVVEKDTKEEALLRSVKISEAVQQLVQRLQVVPAFVIAKGGITSSDIGVKALGVTRAEVLGQAAPGIPVWRTDEGSLFPGIPYIIFPGNVGEDGTLRQVVTELIR
ncbi:uncharacterized protein YgbK (DUF1537 family) [Anaerotaenia torta]|uniref:four-carbon acid sugar kinase family protein n=1 Tax=Anaerotaenia torta TaxID=433293 RepID=UPI003D256495